MNTTIVDIVDVLLKQGNFKRFVFELPYPILLNISNGEPFVMLEAHSTRIYNLYNWPGYNALRHHGFVYMETPCALQLNEQAKVINISADYSIVVDSSNEPLCEFLSVAKHSVYGKLLRVILMKDVLPFLDNIDISGMFAKDVVLFDNELNSNFDLVSSLHHIIPCRVNSPQQYIIFSIPRDNEYLIGEVFNLYAELGLYVGIGRRRGLLIDIEIQDFEDLPDDLLEEIRLLMYSTLFVEKCSKILMCLQPKNIKTIYDMFAML